MPSIYLRHGVYLGRRDDTVIALDLEQDEYFVMSDDESEVLISLAARTGLSREHPAVNTLLDGGILTTSERLGSIVEIARRDVAWQELTSWIEPRYPNVKSHHIWNFTTSCLQASACIRWMPISKIIERVAIRKTHSKSEPLDVDCARELTSIFMNLRWHFPKDYVCLYDSLALIEFLARYEVFPNWVFGVRLEPWSAHCWVQCDGFTFDEGAEEASHFTPVMAV